MAPETATPSAPPTPAADAPRALSPSPEVVNALLRWSEDDRLGLAQLLRDSVREGFGSLAEAEARDQDMIRARIEAYERGELRAGDWRVSLAGLEDRFRAEFGS